MMTKIRESCLCQRRAHASKHTDALELQIVMGFINGPIMKRPGFSRYMDVVPVSALTQIQYTLQEMRFHAPSEHRIDGQA
jgi:hypothetical protein